MESEDSNFRLLLMEEFDDANFSLDLSDGDSDEELTLNDDFDTGKIWFDLGNGNYRITPPPQARYDNEETLVRETRAWCKAHGLDLVRCSKQGRRIQVRCGRYGLSNETRRLSPVEHRRRTNNHKCQCRVSLWYHSHEDGSWSVNHSRGDTSFVHNHPPSHTGNLSANQRRHERSGEWFEQLKGYVELGYKPRTCMRLMQRDFPLSGQRKQDIYNAQAAIKKAAGDHVGIASSALIAPHLPSQKRSSSQMPRAALQVRLNVTQSDVDPQPLLHRGD